MAKLSSRFQLQVVCSYLIFIPSGCTAAGCCSHHATCNWYSEIVPSNAHHQKGIACATSSVSNPGYIVYNICANIHNDLSSVILRVLKLPQVGRANSRKSPLRHLKVVSDSTERFNSGNCFDLVRWVVTRMLISLMPCVVALRTGRSLG